MSGQGALLRGLHRLRRHVRNLQEEIDRIPRQLRAQQARVVKQEEALQQAQEALKKLKVSVHQNETTLKTTHQQVAKFEKQRNEITSKKEYDAVQTEIAHAQQEVRRLEEVIFNGMVEAEEYTAQLPELEKALKKAKEELAQFEKDSKERQARLQGEMSQAQEQLKQGEAALPNDIRPHYQRLVAARGDDGLAVVNEKNCSACFTAITAQMWNDLLVGRLVLCKSCGRILYMAE